MQSDISPEVYQPEDVQCILKIGKTKTYDFLNKVEKEGRPFPIIRVGNLYRIPKTPFDEWLMTGKDTSK